MYLYLAPYIPLYGSHIAHNKMLVFTKRMMYSVFPSDTIYEKKYIPRVQDYAKKLF